MARWLITGGSGFLGINLARHLLQTGHEVATLDKLGFDYKDTVDKVTHYQIDVRNRDAVDRCIATGFDVVVHGAAALPLNLKRKFLAQTLMAPETSLNPSKDTKFLARSTSHRLLFMDCQIITPCLKLTR